MDPATRKYAAYAAAFGLFFAIAGLLHINLKMLAAVPLFFAAAVLSLKYRRISPVPPALEFITLTTVLLGIAYGPLVGAIYGFFVTITSEVYSGGVTSFIIGYAPARALQGALAALFAGANLVFTGIILTVAYNILAQALCLFQGDAEIRLKAIVYVILNVAINAAIFKAIAPLLLMIIT